MILYIIGCVASVIAGCVTFKVLNEEVSVIAFLYTLLIAIFSWIGAIIFIAIFISECDDCIFYKSISKFLNKKLF